MVASVPTHRRNPQEHPPITGQHVHLDKPQSILHPENTTLNRRPCRESQCNVRVIKIASPQNLNGTDLMNPTRTICLRIFLCLLACQLASLCGFAQGIQDRERAGATETSAQQRDESSPTENSPAIESSPTTEASHDEFAPDQTQTVQTRPEGAIVLLDDQTMQFSSKTGGKPNWPVEDGELILSLIHI